MIKLIDKMVDKLEPHYNVIFAAISGFAFAIIVLDTLYIRG